MTEKSLSFIFSFRQETIIANWNAGVAVWRCEWMKASTLQSYCHRAEPLLAACGKPAEENVSPWATLGRVVKQPSSREAEVYNGVCRKCKTLLLIRFITCWNLSKTVEQFGPDLLVSVKTNKHPFAVVGLPGSNISPRLHCSYRFSSLLESLEVWEAELFCFCLLLFSWPFPSPPSLPFLCSSPPL